MEKLNNKIKTLQEQSIKNYKQIKKLQKLINLLQSGKKLYIGKYGGIYYLSGNQKVYV